MTVLLPLHVSELEWTPETNFLTDAYLFVTADFYIYFVIRNPNSFTFIIITLTMVVVVIMMIILSKYM
jgi:hypothetical protein